jgi:hypothetical protein
MLSALITKYTNIKILEVYGQSSNIYKEKLKLFLNDSMIDDHHMLKKERIRNTLN